MGTFRRWARPWAMGMLATIVAACGSSDDERAKRPDASGVTDGSVDASRPVASGGSSGAGGAPAGGGLGMGAFGAGALGGGAPGAGCALNADAATDLQSDGVPPDASLVMDAPDAGARDASVQDAAARDAAVVHDAGIHDAGADASKDADTAKVSYPPLQFSKIGRPAVVSADFLFTEGPVWDPAKQALFFTDINADVVYRLRLPDTLDVAVDHVGNADGLALDPDGNLIGTGFASRDVWRLDGTKIRSLVGEYRGHALNSPDDLVARSDGTIYFTDPTFGIDGSQGFSAQLPDLCFQGVYRLTSDALFIEDSSTAGPNGVNFSPDEKTLYVSYTNSGEVYSFDVAADGSLSKKTLLANVLIADSM
ncbi:MAG TPA: SMP-30/gluconolactonase/LRE family protein, partial [Polyangiaceae bacterium]|nr:SMP-30/gluconolactonase/LRE family protein [Polyangiaceae bacterium]